MAVRHQLPERKYFPPMIVSQDDSIAVSVEGLMERLAYVDAQEEKNVSVITSTGNSLDSVDPFLLTTR